MYVYIRTEHELWTKVAFKDLQEEMGVIYHAFRV
jgi:hypothetical protein